MRATPLVLMTRVSGNGVYISLIFTEFGSEALSACHSAGINDTG